MKKIIIEGTKDKKKYDIEISELVMGSGDFLRIDNLEEASVILDKYVELGGNVFDTARHYRHSEKAIGAWMKERKNREKIVIFTKCSHPVREFPDTPRVTPKGILEDIEESLRMLETNYVDLFALHRDDRTQEVGPLMDTLNGLINEGKVRAIGTSNWELDRIIEANKYADENNLIGFTFNSPNLSLAQCQIPRWPGCVSANQSMISWHEETQTPLISWSSQAGGFFSGKFDRNNLENKEMVEVYYNDENWERYDRAIELSKIKKATPIEIALSFVLNQKFPTAAAIGSERIEELLSSYNGSLIKLNQKEVEYLNLEVDTCL